MLQQAIRNFLETNENYKMSAKKLKLWKTTKWKLYYNYIIELETKKLT